MWRDIPGYDGFYQVNDMGEFRSYRNNDGKRRSEPRRIKSHLINSKAGRTEVVNLINPYTGKRTSRKVAHVVCEAFGIDHSGKDIIHKNGVLSDNSIYNLALCEHRMVGKLKHCHVVNMIPIEKVDLKGNVTATYESKAACAKSNKIHPKTLNRYIQSAVPVQGRIYRTRRSESEC